MNKRKYSKQKLLNTRRGSERRNKRTNEHLTTETLSACIRCIHIHDDPSVESRAVYPHASHSTHESAHVYVSRGVLYFFFIRCRCCLSIQLPLSFRTETWYITRRALLSPHRYAVDTQQSLRNAMRVKICSHEHWTRQREDKRMMNEEPEWVSAEAAKCI